MCQECKKIDDVERVSTEAARVIRERKAAKRKIREKYFTLPSKDANGRPFRNGDIDAYYKYRRDILELINCIAAAHDPAVGLIKKDLRAAFAEEVQMSDQAIDHRLNIAVACEIIEETKGARKADEPHSDGRHHLFTLSNRIKVAFLNYTRELECTYLELHDRSLSILSQDLEPLEESSNVFKDVAVDEGSGANPAKP